MFQAITLEIAVLVLGFVLLGVESFSKSPSRKGLSTAGIFGLSWILLLSFFVQGNPTHIEPGSLWNFYSADLTALFFKRLAIVATLDGEFTVETADRAADAIARIRERPFAAVVMDIRMPEVDGINAISIIRKEYEDLKIIVLTMYDDQEMITKMMEMGASKPWPEALEAVTGKKEMDATAVLEYFAPLKAWLDDQNRL